MKSRHGAIKLRHFTDARCSKKIENGNIYLTAGASTKSTDVQRLRQQISFFTKSIPFLKGGSDIISPSTCDYSMFKGDGTCQLVSKGPNNVIYAIFSAPAHLQKIFGCSTGLYYDVKRHKCSQCRPGTYYPNGGELQFMVASDCRPCPVGTYTNSIGATSCLPCPNGFYQSSTGASSCMSCPAGKYTLKYGARSIGACISDTDIPTYFRCPMTGKLFVEGAPITISSIDNLSYSEEGLKLRTLQNNDRLVRNLFLEDAVANYINDPIPFRVKFPIVDTPKYFKCPLSLSLLDDPVVGVCGHTYSRDMIAQVLPLNGSITADPICRVPFTSEQLIANKALAAAIADSVVDE